MSQYNPIETFMQEAEDLLVAIEQSALDVERDPTDGEALNRLFRSFHTLKGSGSMFGFDEVADFTHHVESALDRSREGALPLTPALIALLLSAKDQIKALLAGETGDDTQRIIAELNALQGLAPSTPGAKDSSATTAPSGRRSRYLVSFRPAASIACSGLDPASLLDELRALGECQVKIDFDRVPPLDAIEPDKCYLSWQIELVTDASENAIRDVFIFVEDESEIRIEIHDTSDYAPSAKRETPKSAATSQILGRKPLTQQATVRVTSEKLDRLVNLVGELVMNQSRLSQVAGGIDSAELGAPVEEIERLISELRDSVLGIRMMPIGSTFSRFRRLVHDLSIELGKDITLLTEGEETELDKTVIDQLGDPLVHLIRNSIDHGIEAPAERAAAGKPTVGSIRLSAAHDGAHVVVTIEDDGRGLDPERIRTKAVEKGLIAADADLAEEDLFNLILLPGFSTAKDITNVSGRGVGMDVVKRQLETLGGDLKISSRRGAGTRIDLSLPLTLAIIDGLLVEIGRDRFIVPMAAVTENVEITAAERNANNGRNLVNVRGELVPYVRLRDQFQVAGAAPAIEKVVIATHNRQRIGFVVDRVLGSHQTVIQSLGKMYEDIEVVSGATIMGDGRVALILDIAGIVRHDEQTFGGRSAASVLVSKIQ